MATCHLRIKLDDYEPRSGGAPISGNVIVKADKETNCKGLVVRTLWSTHGRGNVDTGQVSEQTVFQGTWQAGQEYSYPFKLDTAAWPPTYYGSYLNVGHYVAAQAKLSWAIDPKAQVEYRVVAHDSPADLKPTTAPSKPTGWIMTGIVVAFLGIFAVLFFPLFIMLAVIGGPIGLLVYLFKVVLPKRVTGPVTCELKAPKVHAGNSVEASLAFTPAKSSTINGIEWTLRCVEECVSGSGSNRKTHTNELFQQTVRASESLQLQPGKKQAFDFQLPIANTAAPSLKFSDNKVAWTVKCRIDIPRWPDWTKTLELIVVADPKAPLGTHAGDYDLDEEDEQEEIETVATTPKTEADDAWFRQVLSQLQQSQHDADQLKLVLGAVADFEFPVTVTIEEEIDTPEFTDETEFDRWDEAEWWSGFLPLQNTDIAICWPSITPNHVTDGSTWTGKASIVGYNIENKRVLLVAN